MATERIGKAVLELVTDSKQFRADLNEVKREATEGLPQAFKQARGSLDLVASGMSSAGKEASASAQLIAGMSSSGREAMGKLAGATPQVTGGFDLIQSTVMRIGPAIAGAFSVGAVVSFAKSIGEFAGHMVDLQGQTQINTDRLQAFNYVGAGVGLTIDGIVSSADQLAKRVGGGDDSAVGALERLGIKADEFKQLSLDEAIFKIDERLVGVTNQFDRANTLADLFGKSGAQMGRMLDGSLKQVIEGVEQSGAVIDKDLIKKADEFDDAWTQATLHVKAQLVNMAGAVITAMTSVPKREPGQTGGAFEAKAGGGGPTPAEELAQAQRDVRAQLDEMMKGLAPGFKPGQSGIPGATPEDIKNLERMSIALDKSAKKLVEWNRIREAAIAATEKASEGMTFWLAGMETAPKLVETQNASLTAYIPVLETFTGILTTLPDIIDSGAASAEAAAIAEEQARQKTIEWHESILDLADAFYVWEVAGVGAIGAVMGQIGGMVEGLSRARSGSDQLRDGLKNLGSGNILQGITGIIGGIGGIVSAAMAAISAIKALFNAFKSEETRLVSTPRDQFIAQYGGDDAMGQKIIDALMAGGLSYDAAEARRQDLMDRGLYAADTEAKFHSAEDAIIALIGGTKFARGGIAMRPTFGLFGERGPEAVVPLDRLQATFRSRDDRFIEELAALREDVRQQSRYARDLPFILTNSLKAAGAFSS